MFIRLIRVTEFLMRREVGMALKEDYRDQADECRRLAEAEAEEADRSVWLLLQNAWMQLSAEAPQMLRASPGGQVVAIRGKGKRRR